MINAVITNISIEIISKQGFAEAIQNKNFNQRSLHVFVPFKKGDLICNFSTEKNFKLPNYLTILQGLNEELSFFYPSTELDMAQPFITNFSN